MIPPNSSKTPVKTARSSLAFFLLKVTVLRHLADPKAGGEVSGGGQSDAQAGLQSLASQKAGRPPAHQPVHRCWEQQQEESMAGPHPCAWQGNALLLLTNSTQLLWMRAFIEQI